MVDQELLCAMRNMIKEEIAPIKADVAEMKADITGMKADISEMKADIADLSEGQEELRLSVNTILGWTDKVSEAVNFPLPKV